MIPSFFKIRFQSDGRLSLVASKSAKSESQQFGVSASAVVLPLEAQSSYNRIRVLEREDYCRGLNKYQLRGPIFLICHSIRDLKWTAIV